MTSDAIREALEGAHRYLTEHPDEARYTDSAAVAVLGDGLRVQVSGPDGEAMATDMPAAVGGAASSPTPGWYLRAAEASCVASLIGMRAAQLGVALERVEVTVNSQSDDRGILEISDEVPAGPLQTRVGIWLTAAEGESAADLDAIARWAVDHCPVTDAVGRAVPMTVEVEVS